ncbi:MAG: PspC domain-containing protein [Candidatus Riflebacteria bacterium]|nr:PspC domain-containing protein [Candidatus Riflebacteria bacterium]
MDDPILECPYCRELVKAGAIKCPRCFTVLDRVAYLRQNLGGFGFWLANRLDWCRRQKGRWFLGVCVALNARTGFPLVLLRLLFVLLALTGNHGFTIYVILFLFLPDATCCKGEEPPAPEPPVDPDKS